MHINSEYSQIFLYPVCDESNINKTRFQIYKYVTYWVYATLIVLVYRDTHASKYQ